MFTLDGLQPNQPYKYAVTTDDGRLLHDPVPFKSAPLPGTLPTREKTSRLLSGGQITRPAYRFWVIGDSGTGSSRQRSVLQAYQQYSGDWSNTDAMLVLGDNAYLNGTDSQYQSSFFGMYAGAMAQVPAWGTLGNHDGQSASSKSQTGVFYSVFAMPKNSEAGVGVPSYTKAYYSFTHGNVHVVVLNSFDVSSSSSGPMMTWARADIQSARQSGQVDWVVAMFHHPAYSWGVDVTGSVPMRGNALPSLESQGVDVVLAGHIHSYERSVLLDGHYGPPSTFRPACHALDSSMGRSSAPYKKPLGVTPHGGTVYVVVGCSGTLTQNDAILGDQLDSMAVTMLSYGSLVMDVTETELVGQFVDDRGRLQDEFTIRKAPGYLRPDTRC